MGIFDESPSEKKNTSEVIHKLLALKSKIFELPQKYPTGTFTFGGGTSKAQEQIPTICAVIDDTVKALEKGLDIHNQPITNSQIADGLRRLVNATRSPTFIGLMTTALNGEGIRILESYMNELERIASTIAGIRTEEKHKRTKEKEKGVKKGGIKLCPKCGVSVKEDSLFCENCGADLSKKKSSKSPKMILIIAVVAVVIAGVTYLAFSDLWESTTTGTPTQSPEEAGIQSTPPPVTTTPAPATPSATTLLYQDEAYLTWTTGFLSTLIEIGESIKELSTEEPSDADEMKEENMEELEILYGDLYELAKKTLDEEKEFTISPKLEAAKREFVKILNACRWAGYYGKRGIKNRDAEDLRKKTEYLETATVCIEKFNELLDEYTATK